MNEILEAYKNMQLKPLYREILAEKLFIKEVTVHTLLSKNRSFKTEHLPVVREFTKRFILEEKKALKIVVKAFQVL
jgi:hypothetical protein